MNKRECLLGFHIDNLSFEEAIEYAKNMSGQIVTINPEMMSNSDMKDIVNNSELIIPDGVGVQLGFLIKGKNIKRIPGIQFSYRMLEEISKKQETVGLIGAKPQILEKAVENLKSQIPNLNISYKHDGYYKDEAIILEELKSASPRLVLCALGSPKQELFIQKAKKLMPNSIFIGVGGSFDVWSGEIERAPKIWQNLGIEWLYRTVKEPKRFKRIFPALPLFVLNVLKERIKGEKSC